MITIIIDLFAVKHDMSHGIGSAVQQDFWAVGHAMKNVQYQHYTSSPLSSVFFFSSSLCRQDNGGSL